MSLELNESQLETLIANLPSFTFLVDRHRRFVWLNRVAPTRTMDQVLGKCVEDFCHPDSREPCVEAIERAFRYQTPGYYEWRGFDEGSLETWYGTRVVPLGSAIDGRELALLIATSETQRIRAEEALRTNQARLAEAQRIAKIGSWELDLQTNSLSWSDEIFRIFELDQAVFGASYDAFLNAIHPDDREAVHTAYSRSVATREPYEIVHRLRMADGRIKHVRERCETHYAADGTALRSVGTVQDITKQRQAEEAVEQLNLELEQRVRDRTVRLDIANQELATFTYTVSHDLKAPLRSIDGYSRLLLMDHADQLDDEGRNLLHIVRKSTAQMSALIDDLLAYSHVERRTATSSPVELRPLLDALLAERAPEIAERGVAIRILAPWPQVVADRDGLVLALRNLLENALKFTRRVSEPAVEIGGREQPESWVLWVRDNGVGFDMKDHEHIFGIFQRLHGAEDYPGTGVGLAIVRKAMERMGGRVWGESTPGQGSTFYLEFPKGT